MNIRFVGCFVLVMLAAVSAWAQSPSARTVFQDVKVPFSRGKDRLLVEKGADLIFEDADHRLVLISGDHRFNAPYDAVRKVVLESSIRGTDVGWGAFFGGPVGASPWHNLAAACWAYIDCQGSTPLLLRVGKESAPNLRDKMLTTFGARVTVAELPEVPETIERNALKETNVKYDVSADKTRHPAPELKSTEALIVVACPCQPHRLPDDVSRI